MRAIFLALVLAADIVGAQSVYKCQGPDGRVTYQNTPCTGAASGAQLQGSRPQGSTAGAPSAAPMKPESSAPQAGTAGAKCYEDSDVREIEVRLGRDSLPPEVKSFLGTEQRRVLSCEYATLNADERRRRMEALRDLASPDPSRRDAAMSTINGIYLQKRRQAEKATGRR